MIKSLLFIIINFIMISLIRAHLPIVKLNKYLPKEYWSSTGSIQYIESTNAILISKDYVAALLSEDEAQDYIQILIQNKSGESSKYYIKNWHKQDFSIKITECDERHENLSLYILELNQPITEIFPVNFNNARIILPTLEQNQFKNDNGVPTYYPNSPPKKIIYTSFISSFENPYDIAHYKIKNYNCSLESVSKDFYKRIKSSLDIFNSDRFSIAKSQLNMPSCNCSGGLFITYQNEFLFAGMIIGTIDDEFGYDQKFLILHDNIIKDFLVNIIEREENNPNKELDFYSPDAQTISMLSS